MEESLFYFKEFYVHHGVGSMKVGVDAVLLGCWIGEKATNILDVGTGCGIISLILAQRFPDSNITGIDLDEPSVEESTRNFKESPWKDRLKARKLIFPDDLTFENKYDLIVSNPPYFNSGIQYPSSRREIARHQKSLSVYSLLEYSGNLLKEYGRLAVIFPKEHEEQVMEKSKQYPFTVSRICRVRDREGIKEKRVMMEFIKGGKQDSDIEETSLTLFSEGKPTDSYRTLCKDFYLKF